MLEEASGQDLVQLLHESGVLHRLAGNVEGQIGRIDHAAQKAQPLGQQPLRLVVDEDLLAVERDAWLHAAEAEALDVFLRGEKQCVDGERGVG